MQLEVWPFDYTAAHKKVKCWFPERISKGWVGLSPSPCLLVDGWDVKWIDGAPAALLCHEVMLKVTRQKLFSNTETPTPDFDRREARHELMADNSTLF